MALIQVKIHPDDCITLTEQELGLQWSQIMGKTLERMQPSTSGHGCFFPSSFSFQKVTWYILVCFSGLWQILWKEQCIFAFSFAFFVSFLFRAARWTFWRNSQLNGETLSLRLGPVSATPEPGFLMFAPMGCMHEPLYIIYTYIHICTECGKPNAKATMWVVEIQPMKMVLGMVCDSMGWFMALGLPHHRIFLQSICLPTNCSRGRTVPNSSTNYILRAPSTNSLCKPKRSIVSPGNPLHGVGRSTSLISSMDFPHLHGWTFFAAGPFSPRWWCDYQRLGRPELQSFGNRPLGPAAQGQAQISFLGVTAFQCTGMMI